MASVNSVPENEGKSVKIECEDPEVNVMALKMKANYQKNATEAVKQHAASTANVYINRAGRAVASANAPITMKHTQQRNQGKLPKDCEDVESMKGKFSWKLINNYCVPYIFRVINGKLLKFVSVRMAETMVLSYYLKYLHEDIYKYTPVRSYIIAESEARLLNEINQKHANRICGGKMFFARKDYVVRLEEVREFYTFIELCYKKLMCNTTTGSTEKCGFIRINYQSIVPYCILDNRKHVPLFFFERKKEILERQAVKLENWDLAYLKFCCRIQGITDELFPSDSCTVINFDDLKNYFPPETNFEEYWPDKETYKQFLINQKSTCVNPPGDWIREPPEVAPAENTTHHTLTAPVPVSTPIAPWISYQNRRPPNQMSSTMSQGSSLIRDEGNFVRAGSAASVIGNNVSYSNFAQISRQCVATMNNPMANSNVISYSSQMRQFDPQHSNNSQAQQKQLQQQQITNPQTLQSYSGQSVYDLFTNNQQRYAFTNVGPFVIAPPPETIDSPSSHVPPTVQETSVLPNIRWELTRIPERMSARDTSNNNAYKSSTMSQGRSLIRDEGNFVRAGSAASVIGNNVSYSNFAQISQCVATMYNPMANRNVISHSSQMRQFDPQHSNNSQAQQKQLQQQQITNPQTLQSYSGQSVYDLFTNNQQRYALTNVGNFVIAPPPETIDSPSSHVPPTVQETSVLPNIRWELTRIPERMSAHDTSNNNAYKIQMATLQEKMIYGINAKPYIYSDLMVTLDDLVQTLLPMCTVAKCAYVLNKSLRTTLFGGNSEQLDVLRRNGRITSMRPNDTPMVMLQDVTRVFPQLINALVDIAWREKQIQQYQSAGGPFKRQRTD